ncbi:SCP2 sterol-binding domain-containing protein [Bradyrhizobium sp. Ai1a-2]|uniref:SCP2 sterol-binding domain-containing protein n=1 Tax=Bradyrhizobium sp. Ai1a-2 TaxID=196490 RepID=UPI0004168E2A|nr:SCP2 sterol-binding domain-containing protein [Bradyrhizobium sp. Ai1a-2]
MNIHSIAERMNDKVANAGFDRSVKFDAGSDGVIVVHGAAVSTTDAPTDCTIKLSLDHLDQLVSGELNPTMAYMTGKLTIDGDLSVAVALSRIL